MNTSSPNPPGPALTRTIAMRSFHVRSGWILLASLVVFWEVVALSWPRRYLPPFHDVLASVWDVVSGPSLWTDVAPSVLRAIAGLVVAVVVGVTVGVPLGSFEPARSVLRPLLEFGRALPAPALLSAAIILLGTGWVMRVSLIAFACLFPVLWNAMDGARRVETERIDAAKICGLKRWSIMVKVVLPSSLPQIFAGIRISLGIALIVMVISEMIASSHGLGSLIFRSQRLFRASDTYAGVILLGAVGVLFNIAFIRLERRFLSWHSGWRGGAT